MSTAVSAASIVVKSASALAGFAAAAAIIQTSNARDKKTVKTSVDKQAGVARPILKEELKSKPCIPYPDRTSSAGFLPLAVIGGGAGVSAGTAASESEVVDRVGGEGGAEESGPRQLLQIKHVLEEIDAAASLLPNDHGRAQAAAERLKHAVARSKNLCWAKMYEDGIPGLVVGVSLNGKMVWKHGFGYSDVENKLLASPETVMRIASISKSITMAVVARLWQDGRLDLDKPVGDVLDAAVWPNKHPAITPRQIASHMAGIRHYERGNGGGDGDERKASTEAKIEGQAPPPPPTTPTGSGQNASTSSVAEKKKTTSETSEFELKEYYIKDRFPSVASAVALFSDDQLLSNPGSTYKYTTHGFTLLSAVIEAVTAQPFESLMRATFAELGLTNTCLDEHHNIVYNRTRYYVRDKKHKLQNAPYVDNSYKWAGGGFLSNVHDLMKFGNAMLYSFQYDGDESGAAPVASAPVAGAAPVASAPVAGAAPVASAAEAAEQRHKITATAAKGKTRGEPKSRSSFPLAAAAADAATTALTLTTERIGGALEQKSVRSSELASREKSSDDGSGGRSCGVDRVNNALGQESASCTDEINRSCSGEPAISNAAYHPSPFAPINRAGSGRPRKQGFLKRSTMQALWSPVVSLASSTEPDLHYGMGWSLMPANTPAAQVAFGKTNRFFAAHTGGAVGASSVLLILPKEIPSAPVASTSSSAAVAQAAVTESADAAAALPRGVVVAILCNMQEVGLQKLALELAKEFEHVPSVEAFKVHKVYQC